MAHRRRRVRHAAPRLDRAWAEELRQKCAAAGVAYWFKQDAGSRPGEREELLGRVYQDHPTGGLTTISQSLFDVMTIMSTRRLREPVGSPAVTRRRDNDELAAFHRVASAAIIGQPVAPAVKQPKAPTTTELRRFQKAIRAHRKAWESNLRNSR